MAYTNSSGQVRVFVRDGSLIGLGVPYVFVPMAIADDTNLSFSYGYSLRKLRNAYTGSAIRVRRSYDNAETNIGFASNGALDTTALQSFSDTGVTLGTQDLTNWNSLTYSNTAISTGLLFNFDAQNTNSFSSTDLDGYNLLSSSVNILSGTFSGTINNLGYETSNGGSVGFNGTNTTIQLNDKVLTTSTDFTVSSWVYINRNNQTAKLINWGSGLNDLSIGITQSIYSWTFSNYSGEMNRISYTDVRRKYDVSVNVGTYSFLLDEQYTNQWIDFTVTNSGGTTRIYINGSELRSFTGATFTLSSNPIIGQSFNGRLSKLKMYNRSLSNYEVMLNYTATCGLFYEDHHAKQFIQNAGITNPTQISAIHNLARELKYTKLWDKLKFIYPFVGGTAQAHKLNLKDPRDLPEAYGLSFSGGWTHSSTGALPNGTNAWANTFYNPSLDKFVDKSFLFMSCYTRNTTSSTGIEMGYRSSGTAYYLQVNSGGSVNYGDHYDVTNRTTTGANGGGNYFTNRFIGWSIYGTGYYTYVYRNGTYLGYTQTNVPSAELNYNIYLGALNNQGTAQNFSTKELSFATMGDSLSDADLTKYESIVQRFQTILGRALVSNYNTSIQHPDSDVETFLKNADIAIGTTQSNAVIGLVSAMKLEGIWHKTMAVYPHVGGTATKHRFNIRNQKWDLDFWGGWTHTSTGSKPNGSNAGANTQIIPGVDFLPDIRSGHFGYYTRTDSVGNVTYPSPTYDIWASDINGRNVGLATYFKRVYGFIGCSMTPTVDFKESSGFNFAMRGDISGSKDTKMWTMKNDTIDYVDTNDGLSNTVALSKDGWRSTPYLFLAGADSTGGYGVQRNSDREHSFTTIGLLDMSELQAIKYARIVQKYQETLGRGATITDSPFSFGNVSIKTWYDQGTYSTNLNMNSKVSQPKIVQNGVIVKDVNNRPAIQFDGWNDALFTSQSINFTNTRAIISVNSGTSSGIRTSSNNVTLISTTVDNYQFTALTWTSDPRINNFRMPIRPSGDNSYYNFSSSTPYLLGSEGGGIYGVWGGYSPTSGSLLKDIGVNISSLYVDEIGHQRFSNNFLQDTGFIQYSHGYQPTSGSLFLGGYVVNGGYYMSKGKTQEVLLYNNTSDFMYNKFAIENNIFSYYVPFTSYSFTDTDANKFSNFLRLNNTQANAINNLVTSLKQYNLWDKMVAIYPIVGASSFKHSVNLKDINYSYSQNRGKRLVFQTDEYGSMDQAGRILHTPSGISYLNGYGPLRGYSYLKFSDYFTPNNFHMSYYGAGLTASGNAYAISSVGSNTTVRIALSKSATASYFNKSNIVYGNTPNISGYYIGNSKTNNEFYRNGILLATASIPVGSTMSNSDIFEFANYTGIYQSFATIGYGLTTTEVSQLNTIVQTYQTDLGRILF